MDFLNYFIKKQNFLIIKFINFKNLFQKLKFGLYSDEILIRILKFL